MTRLATALVLLPFLYAVIEFAPPEVFLAVAAITIWLACWECYCMLGVAGARPFKWLGLSGALAVVWSFSGFAPVFEPTLPLVALTLVSVAAAMGRREEPQAMVQAAVSTVMPVVFIGLALSYLIALRGLPGGRGSDLLMLLFFSTIAGDTAAYYVGTNLGRHRMAPRISPKKSWEGAAGGLGGAVAMAFVARGIFVPEMAWYHALFLGLILGSVGMLGDLAASVVKRATGVKDSSGLLPGHGGMLDRMDSLLFAAPVLYYYYQGFLQGTV